MQKKKEKDSTGATENQEELSKKQQYEMFIREKRPNERCTCVVSYITSLLFWKKFWREFFSKTLYAFLEK